MKENAAFGNISNSIVTYKELFKILKDNINLDAILMKRKCIIRLVRRNNNEL